MEITLSAYFTFLKDTKVLCSVLLLFNDKKYYIILFLYINFTLYDVNLYTTIIEEKNFFFLLVQLPAHVIVGFLLLTWRFKYRIALAVVTTLFVGFVFKRYIKDFSFWRNHGQNLIKRFFILFIIGLCFGVFLIGTDILPRSWYVLCTILPFLLSLFSLEQVVYVLYTPSYIKGVEPTIRVQEKVATSSLGGENRDSDIDLKKTTKGKQIAHDKTQQEKSNRATAKKEVDSILKQHLQSSKKDDNKELVVFENQPSWSSQSILYNPDTAIMRGMEEQTVNLLRQNFKELYRQNNQNTDKLFRLQEQYLTQQNTDTLDRLKLEKNQKLHKLQWLKESFEQKKSLEDQIRNLSSEVAEIKKDHLSSRLVATKYDIYIGLLKDDNIIYTQVTEFIEKKAVELEKIANQKLAD